MKTQNLEAAVIAIQDHLLSFAMLLTRNRDDAFDLLYHTTVKVLDGNEQFEEEASLRSSARTIMRNIFIANRRRAGCAAMVADSSEKIYHLNMGMASDFDAEVAAVSVSEVSAAISSFADDFRLPFSMHVAGYRHAEIAERLGLPLVAVKRRIFAARMRLKDMFE